MFKLYGTVGAASIALAMTISGTALAIPITGQLTLTGTSSFQPTTDNGTKTTSNMTKATGIDFDANVSPTFTTSNGSGSFLGVSGTGTITDLNNFGLFSPTITDFLTVSAGGKILRLDLSNITIVSKSASEIDLLGTGTLHLTGFDDDPTGTFEFTGKSSNGASDQTTFTWTATIDPPSPVPEPSVLGVMGGSLLGFGWLRRRKSA
jgi:hypothetical protein